MPRFQIPPRSFHAGPLKSEEAHGSVSVGHFVITAGRRCSRVPMPARYYPALSSVAKMFSILAPAISKQNRVAESARVSFGVYGVVR
jgi:hypothetical protein